MRRLTFTLVLGGMFTFAFGCAITDHSGWAEHKTEAEAKFWGSEISFSGFGDDFDGTYSYTGKYDNRGGVQGKVTITTYRNLVVSAFSRDGIVDRDGDEIQGHQGSLTSVPATPAGQFFPAYVAVDETGGGTCEFFDNIKQDFVKAGGPGAALCQTTVEEVDRDFSLQDAFASLDELFSLIWSGGLSSSFTLDVTSVTLNGTSIPLATPLAISTSHNGLRPINFTIDFASPGGQELIQALLDNTVHGEAVTLGLGFDGGMSINLPVGRTLAFNPDALAGALQ